MDKREQEEYQVVSLALGKGNEQFVCLKLADSYIRWGSCQKALCHSSNR